MDKKNKMRNRSKGPCGGPGQPPCPEEFLRMLEATGTHSSYIDQIKSDMTKYINFDGLRNVKPKHAYLAADKITAQRLNDIKSSEIYQKAKEDPFLNEKGIMKKAVAFERQIEGSNYREAAIPSLDEMDKLLEFAAGALGAKSPEEALKNAGYIKGLRAYLQSEKLKKKYPNIENMLKKKGFEY